MERLHPLAVLALTTALICGFFAAWFSPWLTDQRIRASTERHFERLNAEVSDGCGFNCEDCGAHQVEHIPFGRKVVIFYKCGLLSPEEMAAPNITTTASISLFGTVRIDGFR